MNADAILQFWFTELAEKQHFAKDAALDALAMALAQELVARGDDARLTNALSFALCTRTCPRSTSEMLQRYRQTL
jgi:uncharacterized protein (DUF924 family)